ncbi:hypothetical protein, partial [Mesoflavibacter sp. CH_XMU1422-2]|uniref:hypothetical protein n=1 Tax=Mesoflavibacter sp. CH_XMU1422-2 TaxID=3107770 RepID=UPI00300B645D
KLFYAKFCCFQSSEFARFLRLVFNSAIVTNGLGYEQLRGLARTFASTLQVENSAGIFRISL